MIASLFKAGEHQDILGGDGVYLRSPDLRDYEQWRQLRGESQTFLQPWEPLWTKDELSKTSFKTRIRRQSQERRSRIAFPFFIFKKGTNELLGGLNLTNVRRGVSQAASLGYWMGARHAGQGYMRRGVQCALDYMFQKENLHRIEAACLASNNASIGLLKRVGFHDVGYAKEYLCINGKWQDHVLFACLQKELLGHAMKKPQSEVDGDKQGIDAARGVKQML
ncbi:GNAT family N-acetyltransferase [Flexibacterium corallicola]|uniref:GNAT family N-acetyltransferase n=1 Tax=Flexibacterium corallicola TaxID=3037259 RepID=UPI00286F30B9|nr:GNAT family N-acetyltransferase [Pseudovibrio sp. M1P-2-3]